MTQTTFLLIVFSLVISGGLSFFQYYYKAKSKSNLNLLLAFLRFLSLFGFFLLLINPMISRNTFEIIKPTLSIVVDNSASIKDLNADEKAIEIYKAFSSNKELQEKFQIQSSRFDSDFQLSNTFNFKGTQTNLDVIPKALKNLNKNGAYPTVLITDGNQTSGNDYVFGFDLGNKVFPVVLGDTTKVFDLKINQLNVNKYAFYKNKFPVEVFLEYSGDKNVLADFSISQGNSVFSKQKISFSPTRKTAIVNVLLSADKIGSQVFQARITSNEKEKNTLNNAKKFAVEILDQKTNIAIVSAINHPDIGALKRAIESNAQRKVTVVKPKEIKSLIYYDVLILYQPTSVFKIIFEENKRAQINSFIITGNHTDFSFLNQQQSNFEFKMSNQKEDYLAALNSQFNLFAMDNIGFENLPPLENSYGKIKSKGDIAVLLSSKIRNIETNAPLLAFADNQGKRSAYLLGENIWKWRMQSHIEAMSFEKFDVFMDKIIQYLASHDAKKSLVVNHESFYNSGDAIVITAQYFNKNYEFDEKAHLTISLQNAKTKQTKAYDLLKSTNAYKVNLDGLEAGEYNFKVEELNTKTTYSSHIEILDFDIEKQFVNPDINKLSQLASQTHGTMYYPNQINALMKSLLADNSYQTIQKSNTTRSPLIDWIWLLILISISLASEWFIRKYNGLL